MKDFTCQKIHEVQICSSYRHTDWQKSIHKTSRRLWTCVQQECATQTIQICSSRNPQKSGATTKSWRNHWMSSDVMDHMNIKGLKENAGMANQGAINAGYGRGGLPQWSRPLVPHWCASTGLGWPFRLWNNRQETVQNQSTGVALTGSTGHAMHVEQTCLQTIASIRDTTAIADGHL